ncbi:hypothetical protein FRB99_006205 [Tulasnella sp. 403]|nr:hypothetical protein FRB99_006205 [Tulasnella sp. 403]
MASTPEDERPNSPLAFPEYAINASPSAAEDFTPPKPVKTRFNRRINTCRPCQTAKRACNRERPCKACSVKGRANECVYDHDADPPIDLKSVDSKSLAAHRLVYALGTSLGIPREELDRVSGMDADKAENHKFPIPLFDTIRSAHRAALPSVPVPIRHGFMIVPSSRSTHQSNVEQANAIFGSNWILVAMDDLFGVWSETLGLDMRPVVCAEADTEEAIKDQQERHRPDNNICRYDAVALDPSDVSWVQSHNLEAIRLAYELFVLPAHTQNTNFTGGVPPLVTPDHVARLPSGALRERLWGEFEKMMVLHSGLLTKEFKKRVDHMFQWADVTRQLPPNSGAEEPPPTLAFYAVVCIAFAIGAQGDECRAAHNGTTTTSPGDGDVRNGQQALAEMSINSPPDAAMNGGGATWQSFGTLTADIPDFAEQPAFQIHSPAAGSGQSTPQVTARYLFNLASAARTAHEELDLPPSLDLIMAYMLSWLYLLHPADVMSFSTNCRAFPSSGGPAAVDQRIWRNLGKVVNIARAMGLGIDPDSGTIGKDSFAMGIWEKEMRRRIWWELCFFDLYISECMGQDPLISVDSYDCRVPSDVHEDQFHPGSVSIPPPKGQTVGLNLSHFVHKCRLVKLAKEKGRLHPVDLNEWGIAICAAREIDAAIREWQEELPHYLMISGLPAPAEYSVSPLADTAFPASETFDMQACDLYMSSSALQIRLWTPFLVPSLNARKVDALPALSCTTAIHTIAQAFDHLLKRFKDMRPANLGSLIYGRTVFIAGAIASTVVIRGGPELQFADKALATLRTTLKIVSDPIIAGVTIPDFTPYRFQCSRVLSLLLTKADNVFDGNKASVGTKRKELDKAAQEVMKIPAGYELPYAGRGAVTTSCNLVLKYGPIPKPTPWEPSDPANDPAEPGSHARVTSNRPGPLPSSSHEHHSAGGMIIEPIRPEPEARPVVPMKTPRKKKSATNVKPAQPIADGPGPSTARNRAASRKRPDSAGSTQGGDFASPGNAIHSRPPSVDQWQTSAVVGPSQPAAHHRSVETSPSFQNTPPVIQGRRNSFATSLPTGPMPSVPQTFPQPGPPPGQPYPIPAQAPQAYMQPQPVYPPSGPLTGNPGPSSMIPMDTSGPLMPQGMYQPSPTHLQHVQGNWQQAQPQYNVSGAVGQVPGVQVYTQVVDHQRMMMGNGQTPMTPVDAAAVGAMPPFQGQYHPAGPATMQPHYPQQYPPQQPHAPGLGAGQIENIYNPTYDMYYPGPPKQQ